MTPTPDMTLLNQVRQWAQQARHEEIVAAAATRRKAIAASDEGAFLLGVAYANCGHFDDAVRELKSLLKRNAAVVQAKAMLAKLFIVADRGREAAPYIAALERDAARNPQVALMLADVYLQAGRVSDARDVYKKLSASSSDIGVLLGLAETSLRSGRAQDAYAAAIKARDKSGLAPPVLSVLGPAAHAADDEEIWQAALAALKPLPRERAAALLNFWTDMALAGGFLNTAAAASERLVEIEPSAPRLRLLADVSLSNHAAQKAKAYAERAVALNGNDGASLSMLARALILLGEVGEAKATLRRAIDVDPAAAAAFDQLSQLDARLLTAEDVTKLERLADTLVRNFDDGPKALMALGRASEAQGDYSTAFRRFTQANALLAEQARITGADYHPQTTDYMQTLMQKNFAAKAPPAPHAATQTAAPIFIIGMPRSGTSLIEQILASHPDVAGGGELSAMPEIVNAFQQLYAEKGAAAALASLKDDHWAFQYFSAVPQTLLASARFTDKHPLNFWAVGLIKAQFPNCRIVQLDRHPLDVCLSIYKQRFYRGYKFTNSIEAIAHYYAAYEKMMAHWRDLYGDDIHIAGYEAFTSDIESETRSLLDFCGLKWDPACIAFHKTRREVYTHSAAQVREAINDKAAGRWRRYGENLAPFRRALEKFGAAVP